MTSGSCRLLPTEKFSVYDFSPLHSSHFPAKKVHVGLNCEYTSKIVEQCVKRRPWCQLVELSTAEDGLIQISDFEMIEWDPVLEGRQRASSYIIRKGLSRKAQLALQLKRFTCKHPQSILHSTVPFTLIVQTWNAFDEMKLDLGGGFFASFDNSSGGAFFMQSSLRQRLEWSLADIQEEVKMEGREDWIWILKPSVTNKGTNISVHRTWETILDALEEESDVREWVLQRYLANPLTVNGHKFHLRVYVLCVGALRVYVNQDILMLLAAHKYTTDDLEDSLAHLSNTARGIEEEDFDEKKFVLLLDDLPGYLSPSVNGSDLLQKIRQSISDIVHDLFSAYENEYTIFSPLSNCFELFGLDFMVDSDCNLHLLEVNPGPDFKQTGTRLQSVIVSLWENTCRVILDEQQDQEPARKGEGHGQGLEERVGQLVKVYDKEWSVGMMQGGGGMKLV